MSKIRKIISLIIFVLIVVIANKSYATTPLNFNITEDIVIGDKITVALDDFDGLYAFQADIKIIFSDKSEENKKIIYIKDLANYDTLEVSFNAKVDGVANIYIDNCIAGDSKNDRIELETASKEYSISIATIREDENIYDANVDDSKITSFKFNKIEDIKYFNIETNKKVNELINDTYFMNIDKEYHVKIYNSNNIEKKLDDTLCSKDKIIIYNLDNVPLTKYNVIVKGDVSGNGQIKLYDSFAILRGVLKGTVFTDLDLFIRDINNDNKLTLYDAFSFLRIALL